jgi:hypothetical protein
MNSLILASLATACLNQPIAYFTGYDRDCKEAHPGIHPVVLCRVNLETEVREKVRPIRKGDYWDILTEAGSRNQFFCHGYTFYSPGRPR